MKENINFVNTESGLVKVSSKAQASHMIEATALSQGFKTEWELRSSVSIRDLANKYGINLSDFKRTVSNDLGQHHWGFGPYELTYIEGENGFTYSPTILLIQVPEFSKESEDIADNMVSVANQLKHLIPEISQSTIVSLTDDMSREIIFNKIASATNNSKITLVFVEDEDFAECVEEIISSELAPHYYSSSLITMYFEEQIESLEVKTKKFNDFIGTNFTSAVESLGGYVSVELN